MKKLREYITIDESSEYNLRPANKKELKELINQRIKEQGSKCNLNDIDVSKIKDMSALFHNSEFDGDISLWNVSKVMFMDSMFEGSEFNGDISKWDVSNVKDMHSMFYNSSFDGDISKWNVSRVKDMSYMFVGSPLEGNEPSWYKE